MSHNYGHAPVLNLFGHGQEGLLYVRGILRRSLQERNVQLVGEFLRNNRSGDSRNM